ncbi:MAG: hypothetical protein C0625_15410 [Arcobacter sp.]|nr:MAG: hypothetical protein C0625_15410 [Arcobacter sp.]
MELSRFTGTNLKRYNSMIFAVKELIDNQKIDGYDYMTDTLVTAYYGIENIIEEIEKLERDALIKRQQEYIKQQRSS